MIGWIRRLRAERAAEAEAARQLVEQLGPAARGEATRQMLEAPRAEDWEVNARWMRIRALIDRESGEPALEVPERRAAPGLLAP